MNIKDGSVGVLVTNYGSPSQPNFVAVGYKFKDSVYTIADIVSVVATLNQSAGWYFQDRPVVIGGVEYRIAEVYEEKLPLRKIYKMEEIDATSELFAKLNQFCLPIQYLNIPANLTTYVEHKPEPAPAPAVQPTGVIQSSTMENIRQVAQQEVTPNVSNVENTNQVSHSDIQRYKEYITDEELAKYGDLRNLSDEDLESLENLYEERRGEAVQKNLVSYELPQELSKYNLVYREAVLGKSFLANNGETQDDLNRMKHESGLREVVEAMFSEIPVTEKYDDEDSDDIMNSYRYLGNALDACFERSIDRVTRTPVPVEVDAHQIFLGLRETLKKDVMTAYGTFSNFIDKFIAMQVGDEVLPRSTAQHKGITIEYRTVKAFDNKKGYFIGFVTETEKGLYLFPQALFYLTSYLDEWERILKGKSFASVYNELLEPFCKEISAEGLNYETMKLSSHDIEVVAVSYLGSCVDEESLIYLFQKQTENANIKKYIALYNKGLGNKMLGSKYVLMGDNFAINYLGEEIIVAPIGQPVYNEEGVFSFIENNADFITEIYPGYYKLNDLRSENEIENNALKRVIQSYDEMLLKTWNAGYTWSNELTADTIIPQTQQIEQTQPENVQSKQPEDIFSNQAIDIFGARPPINAEEVLATVKENGKVVEVPPSTQSPVDIFGPKGNQSQSSAMVTQQAPVFEPAPIGARVEDMREPQPSTADIIKINPISEKVSKFENLYNRLDHKDQGRMMAMLDNILDIFSMDF